MSDIHTLKLQASGQWVSILQTLAPQLAQACERPGRHVPCPVHGGVDGFRLFKDVAETGGGICNTCGSFADGFDLLQWMNSWPFLETVKAVQSLLGMGEGISPPSKTIHIPASTLGKDWVVERERLQSIWEATIRDNGRIRQYLESRGLSVEVPPTLRLHPSLGSYKDGLEGYYPTMVARIQRNGETIGLHLTYLDTDGPGKAPIERPKKIRKCVENISGGVIQLSESIVGKPLILAEGIETALAAHQILGGPAWSCLNAGMLERVQLLSSIDEVLIAGDLDRPKNGNRPRGQEAAENLAERLHLNGNRVQIALPPGPIPDDKENIDWLDVLAESREVICE